MNPSSSHTVIDAGKSSLPAYVARLWHHRAVVRTIFAREVKVKYAQTYLGILWSVIQAVVGLSVITFFFGYMMKVDTAPLPYPVFAFPGMIAWYYFSFIVGYSGSSLVQSRHLVQKLNFPKIHLPIAHSLVGLVDFVLWSVLLLILMMILQQPLSWKLFAIPVFMLALLITGLSISLWLCALTVRYRDLLMIIPYIIGFGIFITPVFFPESLVPASFGWVLYLNPMAGIIMGLRWCFIGMEAPSAYYLAGMLPVALLLVSGVLYFSKLENRIADEL